MPAAVEQDQKRRKTAKSSSSSGRSFRSHPVGVLPLGNYLLDMHTLSSSNSLSTSELSAIRNRRGRGLGPYLSQLPDELILENILLLLSPVEVAKWAMLSPFAYALSHHEEMWRTIVTRIQQQRQKQVTSSFVFEGTWRRTCHRILIGAEQFEQYKAERIAHIEVQLSKDELTSDMTPEQRHQLAIVKDQQEPAIKPRYIYSDTLFQPWAAITTDTSAFTSYSNVDRRSADSLTLEEFITQYEQPGIPVIITDLVTKWPAFGQWSLPWLVSHHGDTARFRAEALSMTLREYASYHDRVFADEAPLYLFDKHFGETCPGLSDDFTVPSYFGCEDLFGVLKDSEHGRPDYRWVIVGPDRSASTWHKDPNATSAWNAIVSQTGAKKWMFWPPDMVPPGVYTDKDESEVTSPISVPSWFNSFYKEAHKLIVKAEQQQHRTLEQRPMEAVCNPGEVIFVPSGWWHCVLNLGANIAITQNYVSRRNLTSVAAFLYKKRDQVSGCREGTGESLYERFKEAMQKQHPDYWDAHCSEIEKHEADAAENQPTLWERLQSGTDCGDSGETNTSGNGSSSSSGGFTFGFAF